jgi:hypothetical protein
MNIITNSLIRSRFLDDYDTINMILSFLTKFDSKKELYLLIKDNYLIKEHILHI